MSVVKTIVCVVGARPNFMKIAPIIKAMQASGSNYRAFLVHTGQHYDEAMKATFFQQLGIPEPNIDLEVGSGTHGVQTAQIMLRFEPVLDDIKPCAVLVVGDVNSTIACGLVAVKKQIPVIHVEAGLRSRDRGMPEEINRLLTDQLSAVLFITEKSAKANLINEGIAAEHVHFVGNVMIDSLLMNLPRALAVAEVIKKYKQDLNTMQGQYALLTLHRPSNVDNPELLKSLLTVLVKISQSLLIIFPIHPRTKQSIETAGLMPLLDSGNIISLPPISYLEMLGVMKTATLVLTDSGGIQEETTALGIPCVTLRENTERPITVEQGTNTIVGTDTEKIQHCVNDILATGGKTGKIPEYWDGQAATRIVATLQDYF